MSAPGKYDFTIYRGATYSQVFTFQDSTGAAVNLSSYTADFRMRPSPNYGADTIVKTGLTINGAAGQVTLTISAAETLALAVDEYVYSINLKVGTTVEPFLIGKITVSNEVLV